ncbi:MAG: Mrp/NBP35 family ATP-binding protein [Opitutae bacterium]
MSNQAILNILKQVKYPGFSRDLVSFGLVQQAEMDGKTAKVILELSTADQTLPKTIQKEVEEALLADNAIDFAEVMIRVKKSAGPRKGQTQQESENLSKVKRIIAVASGKGGVGKSTLSVNLSCALARMKSTGGEPLKIGLMDCDLYGPSVPLLIGTSDRPELVGENTLAPVESYGVKTISMGLLIDEESPVVWRGPMIMKTIQQFAHNVVWGELDYLLIDLPPGTGDAQLSLAQILPLDGALLVTTPQKAAVDVARRGARMFEKVNVPILGVVENMSYLLDEESGRKNHLFGQGGGATTAQALKCPFLGEIPLHEEVRLGGDHGTPVVVANPENSASRELLEVARKITELFS